MEKLYDWLKRCYLLVVQSLPGLYYMGVKRFRFRLREDLGGYPGLTTIRDFFPLSSPYRLANIFVCWLDIERLPNRKITTPHVMQTTFFGSIFIDLEYQLSPQARNRVPTRWLIVSTFKFENNDPGHGPPQIYYYYYYYYILFFARSSVVVLAWI